MKLGLKKEQIVTFGMLAVLIVAIVTLYIAFSSKINGALKENFSGNILSIFEGLGVTLLIAITSFLLGILLGTVTCLIDKVESKNTFVLIIKNLFKAYVHIFRGTPMVIQLLVIYYVIFAQFTGDPIFVAVFCFGLNSGAYVSENIRGGINSVSKGQVEAGRSLGLPYSTVMMKVVFPQAFRNALPSLGNEFITLVKETSIVGFISIIDLTLAFRKVANATFDYNTVYLVMGVVYFALVMIFTLILNFIEKRVFKNVKAK